MRCNVQFVLLFQTQIDKINFPPFFQEQSNIALPNLFLRCGKIFLSFSS